MNLFEKLVEVRKCVPYLQKDTKGYQYKYTSGASIISKLREKMDELGLILIPEIVSHNTHQGEKGKYTVSGTMVMKWLNAEAPEESLSVPFAFFGTQDDISKAFGSALTYSERYYFLKFFNIPTDDDDPDAFQRKNENKDTKPKEQTQANSVSTLKRQLGAAMVANGIPTSEQKDFFQYVTEGDSSTKKLQNFLDNFSEYLKHYTSYKESLKP